MKQALVGFALGALVVVVFGVLAIYSYFAMGMAPVATSATPMPFEKKLANVGLHARMKKEMPGPAPFAADQGNLTAGAHIYLENCAVCHGLPGKEETAIARGQFPVPPQLFRGKGVTDDEPGETYWKVANGIRLTGMPGFGKSLSDEEIWQVSLLLANAKKLPLSVSELLENPPEVDILSQKSGSHTLAMTQRAAQ